MTGARRNAKPGKPTDELLEEISRLNEELVWLGRSEFVAALTDYEKMPYVELLNLIGKLSNEVTRARSRRSRSAESSAKEKEKTIKNKNKNIRLNSGNVRNAVILSEILGPPLSKRASRPMYYRTIRG